MKKFLVALMLAMSISSVASAQYVKAFQEIWTVDTTSVYRASDYDISVLVYKQINDNGVKPYNFVYSKVDGIWYIEEGGNWSVVEHNSVADYVLNVCNRTAMYKA